MTERDVSVPEPTSPTDAARREARAAAAQAGTVVRELTAISDLEEVSRLLNRVWHDVSGTAILSVEALRAMTSAHSYLVGAFEGSALVGTALGFHDSPDRRTLHSYMTGVAPSHLGRGLGLALKYHQRSWCLDRDIEFIEWTADPLVARNSYFNISKLGANVVGYEDNYYGAMTDPINAGDESDRLMFRWQTRPELVARERRLWPEKADASMVIAVPTDIEKMRREDGANAKRWRRMMREQLGGAIRSGHAVIGFDRNRGYLLGPASTTGVGA